MSSSNKRLHRNCDFFVLHCEWIVALIWNVNFTVQLQQKKFILRWVTMIKPKF